MGQQHEGGDGVTDFVPVQLSANARSAIIDHLTRSALLSDEQQDAFCKRLEFAIACYHAQIRLAAGQTPAQVRQSIEKFRKKLEALRAAWDDMPASAHNLLLQHGVSPPDITGILDDLEQTLPAAHEEARTMKRSSAARYALALDVAKALQDIAGITPSTDPVANPLTDILCEVIREATGEEPQEPGRLTRSAVEQLRTHHH